MKNLQDVDTIGRIFRDLFDDLGDPVLACDITYDRYDISTGLVLLGDVLELIGVSRSNVDFSSVLG